MIITEYRVDSADNHSAHQYLSIAIVADLHELEPKPVLSRLAEIRANVKKKVDQCLKKIRPPALEKNQAT